MKQNLRNPDEPKENEHMPQSVATNNVPAADTAAQRSDENGYQWFTDCDRSNFYRLRGSGAD